MASFADLRKKGKTTDIDAMKKKFEGLRGGNNDFKDPIMDEETFWDMKHLRGKDGTGTARIRLLPAPEGEDDPFIYLFDYAVKNKSNDKWYINYSPMSLGGDYKDPVYEYNGQFFADPTLTDEERRAKVIPRRKHYICNILVLSDPNKPENEGKVFKWRFGPQIYNIIDATLFPKFDTDTPIQVFDPFDGADLEIRVVTKDIGNNTKVPSYDESRFLDPSPLCSEEEFDDIWNKEYPLKEILDPENFKSYDKLKREFEFVMELNKSSNKNNNSNDETPSRPTKEPEEQKSSNVTDDIDDSIPWDTDENSNDTVEETNDEGDDDFDKWLDSINS